MIYWGTHNLHRKVYCFFQIQPYKVNICVVLWQVIGSKGDHNFQSMVKIRTPGKLIINCNKMGYIFSEASLNKPYFARWCRILFKYPWFNMNEDLTQRLYYTFQMDMLVHSCKDLINFYKKRGLLSHRNLLSQIIAESG